MNIFFGLIQFYINVYSKDNLDKKLDNNFLSKLTDEDKQNILQMYNY